jgi:single-strand DNA-binding protein
MAQGINKVQLIGHIGKDATLRRTQTGQAVASLRLACGRRYLDRNGQPVERTEWVGVVIWGKRAEGLVGKELLTKGNRLYVEGELRTRSYKDQGGAVRYVTEVHASRILPLTVRGVQAKSEDVPPPSGDDFLDDEVPENIPPAE